MTRHEDPRLRGRFPEFSRQSRQEGGIGYPALAEMAKVIRRYTNGDIVDVPMAFRYGAKQLPLGRYMRRKLRLAVGLPESAPEVVREQAWLEAMLPLLLAARSSKEAPSLAEQIRMASIPYDQALKVRAEIYEARGKI